MSAVVYHLDSCLLFKGGSMHRIVLLAPIVLIAAACATEPNQVASNSYDCKLVPVPVGNVGDPGKGTRIEQVDARAQLPLSGCFLPSSLRPQWDETAADR